MMDERVSNSRRAALSPAKLALLKKRIRQGAESASESRAVTRRARTGNPPMSFAQQRLWFLCQLEGSPPYHTPRALHITGELEVGVLARSLGEIVRRHESLRTAFALEDGRPVQIIRPPQPLHLPVVDLSRLNGEEQTREARRLVGEEVLRPFDLSEGELLRVKLIKLGDTEHVAVMTVHHIASDGWSMGILTRELAALYDAFTQGEPSPLPELPVQYADFAVWQREYLSGEVLEEQLSYWRKQLAGAPPVLELPTDRPRPAVQTFRGAKHPINLTRELTAELKALGQREGATLYMVLLAAFQVLLSRYSGQEDVVVGSPIANRNRAETESLIGFFVNALAMRTDLSGDPTFVELLGRVRETSLGAYAHQDLPFEKLIEELQPERNLSHTPLFQVTFALHNAPAGALKLRGLELRPVEFAVEAAKFDLSLLMGESGRGIAGLFEYRSDLFNEETVRRLATHFQNLLEAVVKDPSRRLSSLPLLGPKERERLLVRWNDTRADYPPDVCVHELFEAHAQETPDAEALVFDEERVSYAELDGRANKLARHLRGLGVGPESRVGVSLTRSIEMVVALLAVLKAGGAYVPLDPNHPRERLRQMLEDAEVKVILTQTHLADRLPTTEAEVVRLDGDREK
ncbi:MAG TPA: condensation domain-containing protein, partial [Pyrinomonadaceae bacterium]|nr:condensation domain-containing protein [Pyrinomonadaceae bacterium]